MDLKVKSLFESYQLGSLKLINRIAMAPMTRSFSPGGIPREDVAIYYRKRAENNVGLILTEGIAINHPSSVSDPNIPHIYGEEACLGWLNVVNEVHRVGGKIVAQIWHIGAMRKQGDEPNEEAPPISPSGLMAPDMKTTLPMNLEEIDCVIEAFAEAAMTAKTIGFDGIEIHGAHGYLIDQFFWQGTNERTDLYGGSVENRARFAVEIIRRCRERVGPDFPILFRFSQWKVQNFDAKLMASPSELDAFLKPLVDAGINMFHVSTRRCWEPAFDGSPLTLAGWTKKLSGMPVMAVGSVGLSSENDFLKTLTEGKGAQSDSIELVEKLIRDGEADMIAVGRALLADPIWAKKIENGLIEGLTSFDVSVLGKLV